MAQSTLLLLQLILPILFITATAIAAPSSTSFIDASCNVTSHPAQCVQALSPYSDTIQKSPLKMAQIALNVSLAQTHSSKALVAKLIKLKGLKSNEYEALDDCLDQMDSSIDGLSQSVYELDLVGKNNTESVAWRISNVQTWVSAALTDQTTCSEAFEGMSPNGKTKDEIVSIVTDVGKLTSNALALVNKLPRENTF